MEYEIFDVFPVSIYKTKLGRYFTKEELTCISELSRHRRKNTGNSTSIDTHVLNKEPMANLKKDIERACKGYLTDVVNAKNDLQAYITESWLTFNVENDYHHVHKHPNSYLSGVLYVDADQEVDKIHFYDIGIDKNIFEIESKEYNERNSRMRWFSVKTGDIIIFPSFLYHDVPKKQGNNTRIALPFNMMPKGVISNGKGLTEFSW
jgi:uncharacterized protein (TIGR02466 family)